MEPETKIIEEAIPETVVATEEIASVVSAPAVMAKLQPRDTRPPRDSGRRPGRRPGRGDKERVKPEFDTKIIAIRRVTRVAAGGRRFTFSVAVVSGDKKGRVGVGLGKAGD